MDVGIERLATPLEGPGHKYAFLYGLADPSLPFEKRASRYEDAGKLMALASYGEQGRATNEQQTLIDRILAEDSNARPISKADYKNSPYLNIGLESQAFKDLARRFQDAIFDRFFSYAKSHLTEGLPLLISGGCNAAVSVCNNSASTIYFSNDAHNPLSNQPVACQMILA